MNTTLKKNKIPGSIVHILYLVFFTSLIFSLRAVSSISIAAILLAGIIGNKSLAPIFQKINRNLFLAGCTFLFLLQFIALLYTNDTEQGWSNIRIKSGLLITPLAILCTVNLITGIQHRLLFHYCLILCAATLYCLFISFLKYQQTNDSSFFFYHALVSPLKQHAVYFSLFIAIGLIFLLEGIRKGDFTFSRLFHTCLIVYFSAFLFFLSSKLVIAFFLFYLVYYFIKLLKKNKMNQLTIVSSVTLCIIVTSLFFAVRNPVSERFYEIIKGDINVVTQDKFTTGDYFNGLQFRLLQWRFVTEILNENKRWWIGVGPGDAQALLNAKYISKNMYTGDPARGSRGYLIYNTHNQFLETTLQNGIAGLVVLLVICFSVLKIAIENKNRMNSFIILLLLAWLFTESALETQYGIIIFTFFPLFICTDKKLNNRTETVKAGLSKTYSDI